MQAKTCWVLTVGIPGMDNQSIGLAHALGLEVVQKRIEPVAPWKHLPPQLWLAPLRFLGPNSDAFEPPWPDVVIGTGRLTVAVALAIKRASGGRTFNIRIQDPHAAYDEFDAIVTPRHDRCDRPNVIATLGGLHTITPDRIREAGARFAEKFAYLPHPRVAVLVGGTNKCYRLTPEIGRTLGRQLAALSQSTGAGILLTPSRRTGADVEAALRDALADSPAYIWDGAGENPYLAYLALADYIVVTADSVNMVSEAAATGKPVFVVELEGGSRKFRLFHEAMRAGGYTRPFTGKLESWSYPPLDDLGSVAREIRTRLAAY
ncbi:MAG: mitochondrial fission ELM1 family protein [Betaproteobacteria bacterium]|nr:mitochondrial fission ELM1 family protein [Betaproteobacteria bacterium]